jgi:pimeloyl-ACP methyl ester carboxylesterase
MPVRQEIQFVTTRDGIRIAKASAGRGPVLLRASHWLSHVEYDLESPVWRPWVEALSAENTFVRYDQRGCGLSDREVREFGLDAWVRDLEAVADTLGPEPFALMGMSQGGAVAVSYILRNPGRVSRLILIGAYARGGLRRGGTGEERLEAETLVNAIRVGWGRDTAAFRSVFTNRFIPGGTREQIQWWSDLQRMTASTEVAARTLEAFQDIDVTEEARRIDVPTLVFHSRDDACVPFEEGRLFAGLIPGARFVPLESGNHVLLPDEPAWDVFLGELRGFLGGDARRTDAAAAEAGLTRAEAEVLDLLAEGLGNRAIAERLGKSAKTVRNQVSVVLSKLGVRSRAEAIVLVQTARQG